MSSQSPLNRRIFRPTLFYPLWVLFPRLTLSYSWPLNNVTLGFNSFKNFTWWNFTLSVLSKELACFFSYEKLILLVANCTRQAKSEQKEEKTPDESSIKFWLIEENIEKKQMSQRRRYNDYITLKFVTYIWSKLWLKNGFSLALIMAWNFNFFRLKAVIWTL